MSDIRAVRGRTDLVERDGAIAQLREHAAAAVVGRGNLAWITGEAGVGKTALVAAFLQDCDPGIRVLHGRCDALSTPVPLGPFLDMARTAADVAALVDDGTRTRLYPGFLDLLSAPGRPVVVVLDDVHWADGATLDLLSYVGRRVDTSHALVLATYQSERIDPSHPLRAIVGHLATSGASHHVRLAPLSVDGVAALAADDDRDPVELHRQTGGNPFYVAEVLANPSQAIPPTVRHAVLARHAKLASGARLVLDSVAVAPGSMETWLVRDAVDPDPGDIDACIASGLLVERRPGTLAFRHELARLAVLEELAPGRRTMLHEAVCASLVDAGHGRSDPARIAHHAAEAGDGHRVVHHGVEAARRAIAVGAHREAVAHHRQVLQHAELLEPQELAALLEAHVVELWKLGHTGEALAAAERAVALRRELDDPRRLCDSLRILSRSRWLAGRVEGAEDAIIRAIAVAGSEVTSERARATAHHAGLRMLAMSLDEAVAIGSRAVELASQAGSPPSLARALDALGSAQILAGELDVGTGHLERSLSISLRDGADAAAAHALVNLGSCLAGVRAYAAAGPHLAHALEFCATRDLDASRFYAMVWQARVAFEQGRWTEAGDLLDSVPLDRADLPPFITTVGLTVLGRLRARRGDPNPSEVLDRAWDAAVDMADPWRIWWTSAARGEAAVLAGRPDEAAALLRDTFEQAVAVDHPWAMGELAVLLWRVDALDADTHDLATDRLAPPHAAHLAGDIAAAAEAWEQIGCPYERADVLVDGTEAQQLEAVRTFDRLGAAPAAAALRTRMHDAGVSGVPRGPRPTTAAHPAGLTTRQAEVLELVADGLTDRQIAGHLSISPKTVGHHVSAVLAKLEVPSRHDAAAWFRDNRPDDGQAEM